MTDPYIPLTPEQEAEMREMAEACLVTSKYAFKDAGQHIVSLISRVRHLEADNARLREENSVFRKDWKKCADAIVAAIHGPFAEFVVGEPGHVFNVCDQRPIGWAVSARATEPSDHTHLAVMACPSFDEARTFAAALNLLVGSTWKGGN